MKGTVDAVLNLRSFSCILPSRILSVAYHSFYHLCFQITVCSYIITDQLPTTAESNGLHNRRRYPLISRHTLLFAEAPLQSYFYWLRIIEVNFYDLICDPRPRDGKSAVLRAEASVEGCNWSREALEKFQEWYRIPRRRDIGIAGGVSLTNGWLRSQHLSSVWLCTVNDFMQMMH